MLKILEVKKNLEVFLGGWREISIPGDSELKNLEKMYLTESLSEALKNYQSNYILRGQHLGEKSAER